MTHQTSRSVWFSAGAALLGAVSLAAQAPPRDPSARAAAPAPEAAGTAVVRGHVVAADTGLPLRRATVLLRETGEERSRAIDTDADGAFAFETLPPGRYRLKASKARYVDTALGARAPGRPGRPVDVAAGQKVEGLTIRLALAGVITGRVLDDAGEPVAGAPVMALQRKRAGDGTRLTPSMYSRSTDDTGSYRLFGLAPGRYYLSVQPDEGQRSRVGVVHTASTSLAPTYFPSTPVASEAQAIDVAAGTETNADITLVVTQVTTVSGEVVDADGRAPIVGFINLMARGEDGAGRAFAGMQTMNKSGAFTLSGVAPGDYTLQVHAYFDEAEMRRVAISGTLEGHGVTMPLSVSGTAITDLRIVVPPAIEVAGRVHFEGEPPSGGPAAVSLLATAASGPQDGSSRTQVGPDGRFTLPLQAGSWRISAWAPSGWMMKRLQFAGRAIDLDAPVEITGEPGARLDVLLTSQLTAVTGTVSDADGKPLVNYHAVIFPADQTAPRWDHHMRFERADAQGRFRVEALPPGNYLVAAIDDIEPNEAFDEDMLAALRPGAVRVRIREGQTETVALKLAPVP